MSQNWIVFVTAGCSVSAFVSLVRNMLFKIGKDLANTKHIFVSISTMSFRDTATMRNRPVIVSRQEHLSCCVCYNAQAVWRQDCNFVIAQQSMSRLTNFIYRACVKPRYWFQALDHRITGWNRLSKTIFWRSYLLVKTSEIQTRVSWSMF